MKIENIILLVSILILNAVSFYMLLRDKNTAELKADENPVVSKKAKIIYSTVFIVINLAIFALFITVYSYNSIVYSLKRFCMLSILWPIGLIDYKTYKIPNLFILLGLCYRVLLIVPEFFLERPYILGNIIGEIVAAVAVALAAFLCSVCIKNSIGYGDVKLFIVMGLLLGTDGTWGAIFVSLILAFIASLFLMITKKKGRKDVVPFAPAIMLGTYISVILTGM